MRRNTDIKYLITCLNIKILANQAVLNNQKTLSLIEIKTITAIANTISL